MAFTLPYAVRMIRGYRENLPVELEEGALIDGCTRGQALLRVALPVARSG
jgi:multiple sugar transport system permease protein